MVSPEGGKKSAHAKRMEALPRMIRSESITAGGWLQLVLWRTVLAEAGIDNLAYLFFLSDSGFHLL